MVKSPKAKKWLKWSLLALGVLVVTAVTAIGLVFSNQDDLVNKAISGLNKDFKGRLEIAGSHISPFKNFPYISIDLENIKVYEGKDPESEVLLDVKDTYVGFDFWTIITGRFEFKTLRLENGFLKLVQHRDGSFNIANALTSDTEEQSDEESNFYLNLKAIQLINIDLMKLNEENNVLVEAFIEDAQSSLKTARTSSKISLDTRFLFNLIIDGDTSFLHHKHVDLHTTLFFDNTNKELSISPSEVVLEKALFLAEGKIDVDDDMNLDLKFSGNKPNFDLFLAFIPEELAPVFNRYDNGGRIYFDAALKGKSINGQNPQIDINFGCSEAYIENTAVKKEVNELYFEGHFTNGALRNPSTMSLAIQDFSAKPEAGDFKGDIVITNFESPDIEMEVSSEFDLDFLAKFLNIDNLENVNGKVSLTMNFHDIIDFDQPEKSIEKLNEAYFAELKVENLNFNSTVYPLPVRDVNIKATMDGHEAKIDQLDFKVGNTDVALKASISDLPAILHHTDTPVDALLDIESSLIDLQELTSTKEDTTGFDEQIKDLSLFFRFRSSARAFTESPTLPTGEFFIEQLNATLTHYPHKLHDFNADIFIDDNNFRVIDFTGMLDKSDFHFNGRLENYDLWFENKPIGGTQIDFNLTSSLLQLEDLFAYGGENYVPEDYRHEEFRDLKVHGLAKLDFDKKLKSTDVKIDRLEANMNIHSMRFEEFSGDFFIDSTQLKVKDLGGRLGNSQFRADLTYYLNADSTSDSHSFSLNSQKLDFDQLFAYTPPPENVTTKPEDHESGFNLFELPFSNMKFDIDIEQLNYHRYKLGDFVMQGRMQSDHYVYLDTMSLKAAGGDMKLKGYLNGSNPKAIYFSPEVELENIDLDQLLFKFENFGQDHLVSENLHGRLTGTMNGKVHMHADMVPIIDDSELHINFRIVDGSLNDYPAFDALSSYFTDKNLSYIRFDTLENQLDLKNGTLTIPGMNINSTIGYFELSGTQGIDLDMEYYLRVPWKVVTKAGFQKLFKKKNQDNTDQVDEIQYQDENKRARFLNLKIKGTPDDYKISLGKDKK